MPMIVHVTSEQADPGLRGGVPDPGPDPDPEEVIQEAGAEVEAVVGLQGELAEAAAGTK